MVFEIFDKFITFVMTSFVGPSLNTLVENGPGIPVESTQSAAGLGLPRAAHARPLALVALGDACVFLTKTSQLLKGKDNPQLKYSWKNRL